MIDSITTPHWAAFGPPNAFPKAVWLMTLPREDARSATVDLLKDATTAGARVYATRLMPPGDPVYPLILVHIDDEGMTASGIGVPQFAHDLTILIDARMHVDTANPADCENALDRLCEAILNRLLTSPDWVRRFERIASIRTRISVINQGEATLLTALIGIGVTFRTVWEPIVADAFASAHVGVDAIDPSDPNLASPGPDGRPEAGGTFPIPTT
ncbi:hypothetical protein [Azospirillum soli]|uniref:hypothetical protein n=1 Tax=Azospirillum soli TaxID=1304799 RepID=UPI001AEB0EE3|nr:hypothetical protein [Azospirillum soli]MBP2314904.1 hypothetical protein [Azospirillum soli]